MKLKMLLLVVFAAGLTASLAFADETKPKDKASACKNVHLQGTIAPQSLAMTVTHAGPKDAVATGSTVNLTVGTTGQTVRINVEACSAGGAFTVKHLELTPQKPKPSKTTTTSPTTTTP